LRAAVEIQNEKKKLNLKNKVSDKKWRQWRKSENEFKRDALYVELQWKRLEDAYKNGGGNPLVHYFKLLVGVIG
jgi:hypothetical protein